LLRRAAAHDPDAWRRLVAVYAPLVQHWCRQAGLSEHDVADVSQEVFAVVASSLGKFRPDQPGTSFRAWMRGIARNKLKHHLRRWRQSALGGSEALLRLKEIAAPAGELELSESPHHITALYQRALRQVQYYFEERTWIAFWRVTIENHPAADVATELGISVNAVRLAKSHVLRRLRDEMGEVIA
jgi:RNA polymerase sigma-70 factor (ECF subfamily)